MPDTLDDAGITVNKNTIPFETRSPFQASGVRLGLHKAVAGMKEGRMAAKKEFAFDPARYCST